MQQLAANNLPFTFVYGHYPAFAVDPTENSLADHQAARDAFWKSLGDSSVNIYFAGHNHMYNRAEVSINGGPEIQQIVVGTGGAPLGSWDGKYTDPRVILESHLEGQYGYTLVTVDGNKITVVYYAFDGVSTWTPFDTYIYTLTSRKFGANDANQSIDPATLTNYYQGTAGASALPKLGWVLSRSIPARAPTPTPLRCLPAGSTSKGTIPARRSSCNREPRPTWRTPAR